MEKKGRKKKVVIICISAVVAIFGIVLALLLMKKNKKEDYRLLKILEFEGDATVERSDIGEISPYVNMVLESGDRITLSSGTLTILADEDKYIYLDEGTVLVLKASGNSRDSRTEIELEKGGITCDVQNKLSEDSSYEINTPNSSMSIRGTIVYVSYDPTRERGITLGVTFEGVMESILIYEDGTRSDQAVSIPAGTEVEIYRDEKTTDYVLRGIDYNALPEHVLRLLQKKNDSGRDTSITNPEIDIILNGPYTVTFIYKKEVFATQTVNKGEKVVRPTLNPAPSGGWDYDFDKTVQSNITIEWK